MVYIVFKPGNRCCTRYEIICTTDLNTQHQRSCPYIFQRMYVCSMYDKYLVCWRLHALGGMSLFLHYTDDDTTCCSVLCSCLLLVFCRVCTASISSQAMRGLQQKRSTFRKYYVRKAQIVQQIGSWVLFNRKTGDNTGFPFIVLNPRAVP